jgi:hypothetical protein
MSQRPDHPRETNHRRHPPQAFRFEPLVLQPRPLEQVLVSLSGYPDQSLLMVGFLCQSPEWEDRQ